MNLDELMARREGIEQVKGLIIQAIELSRNDKQRALLVSVCNTLKIWLDALEIQIEAETQ